MVKLVRGVTEFVSKYFCNEVSVKAHVVIGSSRREEVIRLSSTTTKVWALLTIKITSNSVYDGCSRTYVT